MGKKLLSENVKKRILRIKRQNPSLSFEKISYILKDEGLRDFKPRTINSFYPNKTNIDAKECVLKAKVYTFQRITDNKWKTNKAGQKLRNYPKFGVEWKEYSSKDYITQYQFQNPVDMIEYLLDRVFYLEGNRPPP